MNYANKGKSQIIPSFVFVDVLTNVERVADLAEDVANAVIAVEETHRLNPTEQVVY